MRLRVEPDARLDANQGCGCGAFGHVFAGSGLLGEPVGPEALNVELHEAGGIGVAAIDEDLDRSGFAAAEPVAEIRGQDDDALQPAGDQVVLDLTAVAGEPHVEVARVAERGHASCWPPASSARQPGPRARVCRSSETPKAKMKRRSRGSTPAIRKLLGSRRIWMRLLADQPDNAAEPAGGYVLCCAHV